MATKAGLWIDRKQAIVILISDKGQEIKRLELGTKQSVRPARSPKKKYTPNDFIAEDRRERKIADDRRKAYDEVLACVRGADSLLILGPGEAKGEFIKHFKSKKLRGVTVEMETTDRMTDRQVAAKVGKHFTKEPASKSVATNKTANVLSGKRPKKTRK